VHNTDHGHHCSIPDATVYITIRRQKACDKSLDNNNFTNKFITDLYTTCKHIADELNGTKRTKFEFGGITIRLPRLDDWIMHAIALYVTEITLSTEGWEHITAEWVVYDVMFANALNNFDAFIDILVDNPLFHILKAQQSKILTAEKWYPELSNGLKKLYSMVKTLDIVLWTLGDFHPEVLCGVSMT
jgi:hypothetical protein